MKKMVLENERMTVVLYYSLLFLSILLVLSTITGIRGSLSSKGASSTPIGSTGNFERSQATATLKGYYTDKNKDVLVALIKLEENTASPLPYEANDYLVTYAGKDTLNAFFGRYSTDGDLYVIVPYPSENKTYSIQITNKNYLGAVTSDSKSTSIQELTGSVSEQLSSIPNMGQSIGSVDSDKTRSTDTISFQMTISPKLKDKEYDIKVIDSNNDTLLQKNNKGNLTFDFETFWEEVYKQPLIDKAEKNLEKSVKTEAELTDRYNQAKKRYNKNKDDKIAQQQMSEYSSKIDSEQNNQSAISEKIKQYRQLKFDSDDFSNYTTKIYGIN